MPQSPLGRQVEVRRHRQPLAGRVGRHERVAGRLGTGQVEHDAGQVVDGAAAAIGDPPGDLQGHGAVAPEWRLRRTDPLAGVQDPLRRDRFEPATDAGADGRIACRVPADEIEDDVARRLDVDRHLPAGADADDGEVRRRVAAVEDVEVRRRRQRRSRWEHRHVSRRRRVRGGDVDRHGEHAASGDTEIGNARDLDGDRVPTADLGYRCADALARVEDAPRADGKEFTSRSTSRMGGMAAEDEGADDERDHRQRPIEPGRAASPAPRRQGHIAHDLGTNHDPAPPPPGATRHTRQRA